MSKKRSKQLEGYKRAVDARIGEFFNGYVTVGFVGDDPVIIRGPADTKTTLALNVLMSHAIHQVHIGDGPDE